jgi:predicted kinase
MKYINDFEQFSVNEMASKNDPIPEINNSNKLGIILLGTPGVGKSTFAKSFILNKKRDIKIFSTDDVSLTLTKRHDVYRKGSSELNIKRLNMFIDNGGSFIYDTTGVQRENIANITKKAKDKGYDVIYVHLMAPLDTSIKQNSERERNVPNYYIKHAYEEQYKNMHYFSSLKPDSYYIVYNIDGKYKFNKFENSQILKRKTDKYKPLNISKFESFNNWSKSKEMEDDRLADELFQQIINSKDDIIDLDYSGRYSFKFDGDYIIVGEDILIVNDKYLKCNKSIYVKWYKTFGEITKENVEKSKLKMDNDDIEKLLQKIVNNKNNITDMDITGYYIFKFEGDKFIVGKDKLVLNNKDVRCDNSTCIKWYKTIKNIFDEIY